MNKHYERDLDRLNTLLEEQLERVRQNARIILLHTKMFDQLIPDTVLDREEVVLEEECLKISALHQPVADDLRYLTVVMKSNRDLERIGDLLEEIKLRDFNPVEAQALLETTEVDISGLLAQVEMAVVDACDCLLKKDQGIARRLWKENKTIETECQAIQERVRAILTTSIASGLVVDTAFCIRFAERIADHAANIAKDVLYLSTGEIVRHRRKEVLG